MRVVISLLFADYMAISVAHPSNSPKSPRQMLFHHPHHFINRIFEFCVRQTKWKFAFISLGAVNDLFQPHLFPTKPGFVVVSAPSLPSVLVYKGYGTTAFDKETW